MQRVPAHCGLPGNERADTLAKEASALPHDALIDAATITKAVRRSATAPWKDGWPEVWFKSVWGPHLPGPVEEVNPLAAMDVHQLRADHWGCSG